VPFKSHDRVIVVSSARRAYVVGPSQGIGPAYIDCRYSRPAKGKRWQATFSAHKSTLFPYSIAAWRIVEQHELFRTREWVQNREIIPRLTVTQLKKKLKEKAAE